MEIPKKMLERWKALRSAGDAVKMTPMIEGGYPEMFQRAFKIGRCSEDVFRVMAKYYAKKANLIKEYL